MSREIRLIEVIDLEIQVMKSGSVHDAIRVWSVNFYHQRPFWYEIFTGFTNLYDILFLGYFLQSLPVPSYSEEYLRLRWYLRQNSGIKPIGELIHDGKPRSFIMKLKSTFSCGMPYPFKTYSSSNSCPGSPSTTESFIAMSGYSDDELTPNARQSKLSQEQLNELQRSTHFDKKELQQWYKGALNRQFHLEVDVNKLPQAS